jgi:hypothetical protein
VVRDLDLYPARLEYEVKRLMYLLSKTYVPVNDGVRNSVFIWWKLLMALYSDAKRTTLVWLYDTSAVDSYRRDADISKPLG